MNPSPSPSFTGRETGVTLTSPNRASCSPFWCQQAPPRHANLRLRRPAQHLARCSPARANASHSKRKHTRNCRKPTWAALPCCCPVSVLPAVLGRGARPRCSPCPVPREGWGLAEQPEGWGAGSSWIPSGAAKFLGFSGSGRRGRGESVSGSRSKQGPGCGAGSGQASAVPRLPERRRGGQGQPRPSAVSPCDRPGAAAGSGDAGPAALSTPTPANSPLTWTPAPSHPRTPQALCNGGA